jgi:hypothetical protein
MNQVSDFQPEPEKRHELLLQQYTLLADRRLGWDSMLNNAPNAALTALAFLLLIALSPDSSDLARLITSAVSLLVSISAISSLGRFRLSELTDAELLLEIEVELGVGANSPGANWVAIFGPSWAKRRLEISARERKRSRLFSLNRLTAVLGARRAFNFWISVFLGTALIAVGVMFTTLIGLQDVWQTNL